MGLRDWFQDKKWSIGDHRVKKKEIRKPGTAPAGVSDKKFGRKITRYQCVDCEKTFDNRESFKDEECFEVIR